MKKNILMFVMTAASATSFTKSAFGDSAADPNPNATSQPYGSTVKRDAAIAKAGQLHNQFEKSFKPAVVKAVGEIKKDQQDYNDSVGKVNAENAQIKTAQADLKKAQNAVIKQKTALEQADVAFKNSNGYQTLEKAYHLMRPYSQDPSAATAWRYAEGDAKKYGVIADSSITEAPTTATDVTTAASTEVPTTAADVTTAASNNEKHGGGINAAQKIVERLEEILSKIASKHGGKVDDKDKKDIEDAVKNNVPDSRILLP